MDERSLFLAALERPDPAARHAWLRDACGNDPALQERVQTLLQAHEQAGSLLDGSPPSQSLLPTQEMPPNADTRPPNLPPATATAVEQAEYVLSFLQPTTYATSLGRLGPYEILSVIGQGGMGIVLKGYDQKLNRHIAVKVLGPELAQNVESRKRFLREAQAAAAVIHPHVVTIHAVDDEQPPYLVMELVTGESLQDRLDRAGPLSLLEILRIGGQIAAGLAAAHARNLVHRDIKPANILLESVSERVKITDFGLARATNDVSLTSAGLIVGTPLYMSPEQAQGRPVDHRSDLFSLGSVLHQMATGQAPFTAESAIAVIRRVIDDEPPPVHKLNKELPPCLSQMIQGLLEKVLEDRIASADVVAQQCEVWLHQLQHGVLPKNLSPVGRFARPHRSSSMALRVGFSLAMIVFCLACWATAFDWWTPLGARLGLIPGNIALQPQSPENVAPQPPIETNLSPAAETKTPAPPLDPPGPEIAKAPFTAAEAVRFQEDCAHELGVPVEFSNSLGIVMRLVPPGEYQLGSTDAEKLLARTKCPPTNHLRIRAEPKPELVMIKEPFYLSKYEVTYQQFQQFGVATKYVSAYFREGAGKMLRPISYADLPFKEKSPYPPVVEPAADRPVRIFAAVDAEIFCEWLSDREGGKYTLPTEHQWEFACRAGSATIWPWGDDESLASQYLAEKQLQPVGQLQPNAFGFYDMLGNACELTYPALVNNPMRTCGGQAGKALWVMRPASRNDADIGPDYNAIYNHQGIRLALTGNLKSFIDKRRAAQRPETQDAAIK